MTKKQIPLEIASILAHDQMPEGYLQPHLTPLYLSSTYIYESPEAVREIFKGNKKGYVYGRWSHPNADLVERKLEALEVYGLDDAKCRALLFSSGMAAISALFQSMVKPGDALIVQGNIYGTTVDYINHVAAQFGLKVYYEDLKNLARIEQLLQQDTHIKLLYAETPSNPTINCYDLKALSKIAHAHKVKVAVDNTFATALLQQPLALGVDYVIYSSTKYLNGHGTGVSGVLIGSNIVRMNKVVWNLRKLHGSICAPFDAWMLNLGMKTLPLRMKQHCINALAVAKWLQSHPSISHVNYLGLKNHPDHKLAAKQMRDYGGVLSFEMRGGIKAGEKLMKRLKLCQLTASLGTTDTLIQHPASMSHSFVPREQRIKFGITDGLVRLSVGIEDVQDIIRDLEQGLK
jgi:methionine-gamma-lyase